MAHWLEKVPHCVSELRGTREPPEGRTMIEMGPAHSYREGKETG